MIDPTRTPDPGGADPATVFRGVAGILYAQDDVFEVYRAACRLAPELVTGCDHASLMLLHKGIPITAAASSEVAEQIDRLERELGEGPCLDAIADDGPYLQADLTDGSPWPQLSRRTLDETPVRGAAGFRLILNNQKLGALNLFSETPGGFSTESVNQGIMLAAFVSVALEAAEQRRNAANLRAGLTSNREIGKAVGLLMAFHKIGDDDAFEILRKTSQDLNMKLAEVARQVVEHQVQRPR